MFKPLVAAIVAIVTLSAPVSAADPPDGHPFIHDLPSGWLHDVPDQYRWASAWGGWVDVRCGTSQEQFRLVVYEHAGFGGDKTRVCHSATNRSGKPTNDNWCEVPLGPGAKWEAVDRCLKVGDTWGVANDRMSSLLLLGLDSDECLRFFVHAEHDGRWFSYRNGTHQNLDTLNYPNANFYFNDKISSTKKKEGSACGALFGEN